MTLSLAKGASCASSATNRRGISGLFHEYRRSEISNASVVGWCFLRGMITAPGAFNAWACRW